VIIEDDNFCRDSIQLSRLNSPAELITDTTVTDLDCFGDGDGSIITAAAGGTAPYDYEWSIVTPGGGIVNATATNQTTLSGGEYQVIVIDDHGCRDSLHAIEVIEPTEIFANGIPTDNSCYDIVDGEINITPSGGTAPYTFDWDNDGTTDFDDLEDLIPIDSGCYVLVVEDLNGCRLIGNDTTICVTTPDPVYVNATLIQDVLCNADLNGLATFAGAGGAGGYVFDTDQPLDGNYLDAPLMPGLQVGSYISSICSRN